MTIYAFNNARDLARYVVKKCIRDHEADPKNKLISNLQLQKILYFLQTIYCSGTRGSLIFADEFFAWPYGPVLPDVYFEFCLNGGSVIRSCEDYVEEPPQSLRKFLDVGIEKLRTRSPWDLVQISHAKGMPWDVVYQEHPYGPISNQALIEAYA